MLTPLVAVMSPVVRKVVVSIPPLALILPVDKLPDDTCPVAVMDVMFNVVAVKSVVVIPPSAFICNP